MVDQQRVGSVGEVFGDLIQFEDRMRAASTSFVRSLSFPICRPGRPGLAGQAALLHATLSAYP
jgi:hypothetical protein